MSYDLGKDLLPPPQLLSDGTTNLDEYVTVGTNFVNYFLINHAALRAHESVLDVGSGIGQKARALSAYLKGNYEGIDIMPDAIAWCQEAYVRFPNFRFRVADIHSAHYNPGGKVTAEQYAFPYPDESFDLVLLSSVFTHMLPEGVSRYFEEIRRVLRPTGRCVATFFLLNQEAIQGISAEKNVISAPHVWSDGCYVADLNSPETTVFHDESRVRQMFRAHGLNVVEITFGFWSGRKDLIRSLQDVVIAVRA
jgi:SAM-dependent methyltransferase